MRRLTFWQRLSSAAAILSVQVVWIAIGFAILWQSKLHQEVASEHVIAALTLVLTGMALTTVFVPRMMFKRGRR